MLHSSKIAIIISFICGFTSLSIEVLWIRLYSFTYQSTPFGFGFVLSSYLFGISLGAYFGGVFCKKNPNENLWRRTGKMLVSSAIITLIAPQIFAALYHHEIGGMFLEITLIVLSSASIAYIFPIAHHLGVSTNKNNSRQGRNFASVYIANIMGAALGPIFTGYILIEIISLQQSFVVISYIEVIFGIALLIYRIKYKKFMNIAFFIMFVILSIILLTQENYLIKNVSQGRNLIAIIENRHGIITIDKGYGEDIIYGGNVYDGRTNTSLLKNTNNIHRLVLLSALRPNPQRVLMIGLSIGSWLQIVRNFPGVEHIDVIEINPGYLKAIENYPSLKEATRDPRVHIHINDARRWIKLHPDSKYDMIIMNTTWHWRANTAFLLSREMLTLIKSHMNANAIMAFNSTSSPDAFYTAAEIFPYSYRFHNFIYNANYDFRKNKENFNSVDLLKNSGWKGVEPITPEQEKKINVMFGYSFVSIDEIRDTVGRPLEVITDTNMINEYKYGKNYGASPFVVGTVR